MQKETFPNVVSLESLDFFNKETADLVHSLNRIKFAWLDSVLPDKLKSSKSEVLNSREMAIALRAYLFLDKNFNTSIDDLFLSEHKNAMEQALRLAFRDYLGKPEHEHWKYILGKIKDLPQWKDFYDLCDYFASIDKKLKHDIEKCWKQIEHISFRDAIIAVSILHWQAISSKEVLPYLITRTATHNEVLLSQQSIVTALGKYLKRVCEKKGCLGLSNFKDLHLYVAYEIGKLVALEEQGKKTELDNVWKYIQALHTMENFMQNDCSTFRYEPSLQVDTQKDDCETTLKNSIIEHVAQNVAAEHIHENFEETLFGSEENHILNQQACIQTYSGLYILNEFYGISDDFNYHGHSYKLFEILRQAEMLRALFDSEFLKKWENFNPSMSKFIIDGSKREVGRLPIWLETFSSLTEKDKNEEHVPDKENFSLLSIDVKQEKSKFDLLLYPILRYEENLIIFPFMYALLNPHISILNLLKRNKENEEDSRERDEESRNVEKTVARMLKPIINFQKAKILSNKEYGENKGELDAVLYADKTLLIIEVKSVYRCNTMEDRHKHEKQLIHAGHQLNRGIKALSEDAKLLSEITGDSLIKFTDIKIETLIISTSFEFDHQRFSGHLKISLLELMILCGHVYPDQLFGAETPFIDILKDSDIDSFNKLKEMQTNMPKNKEEQDRQRKEAEVIAKKIENVDYFTLVPDELKVHYKEPTIEHLMDCLNSNSVWEWVLPYWQ